MTAAGRRSRRRKSRTRAARAAALGGFDAAAAAFFSGGGVVRSSSVVGSVRSSSVVVRLRRLGRRSTPSSWSSARWSRSRRTWSVGFRGWSSWSSRCRCRCRRSRSPRSRGRRSPRSGRRPAAACCRAAGCAVGAAVLGLAHQSGSGPRASPLLLRSEYRVEDRVGVLDLEAVSQPRLDLLPAAAGDRHLGRQQARPGGAAVAARRLGGRRLGAGSAAGARLGPRGSGSRRAATRLLASVVDPAPGLVQRRLQPLGLVAASRSPARPASRSARRARRGARRAGRPRPAPRRGSAAPALRRRR